jgi:uncharacterized protein YPO0396
MTHNLYTEQMGFRLERLELYNWGTFDGVVWTMTPSTQTAVLTGANGSGKSTIVDALLTLLVDSRKRNYNVASGAGSKRERSERSYVKGEFSRSQGGTLAEARANALREKNTFTVLLAVFRDDMHQRVVTLAQVLWISNSGSVDKRYYVAPCDLTIAEHFSTRIVDRSELPEDVTLHRTFKAYIAAARKALGLAGKQKALDLFNQTVAVKDIDSLNAFVREHMLDKKNSIQRVDALRSQYRDLNEAHLAIVRARSQLATLAPLVEAAESYRHYQTQIEHYEQARGYIPYYVALRGEDILTHAIREAEAQIDTQESRMRSVDNEIARLQEETESIRITIATDDVGQQKREIESKLPFIQRQIEMLKTVAARYDQYARRLDLNPYHDEEAFTANRRAAAEALSQTREDIGALDVQRDELRMQQRDLGKHQQELEEEIAYLQDNLSNIPARVARIREQIADALTIPATDIPFVGELLRVRDDRAEWEGTVERLLHSFALNLLIPDELYHPISTYVNTHNLKGRLVYQRVKPFDTHPTRRHVPPAALMAYECVVIKDDTPFYGWVEGQLTNRFNYVCCPDIRTFQRESRAITRQGQIKHSATRHEKDDRRHLTDRRYFVLGWDNRQKLEKLQAEVEQLYRQSDDVDDEITHIEHRIKRYREDIRAAESLLEVAAFSEIDWRSRQAEQQQLERQLTQLDDSHLHDLENRLADVRRMLSNKTGERDDLTGRIATVRSRLNAHHKELERVTLIIQQTQVDAIWDEVQSLLDDVDQKELTLADLRTRPSELDTSLQSSVSNFRRYQTEHQTVILNAMHTFRVDYPDEGVSLSVDMDALPAYESIHQRLDEDDLPQYEKRFKQMLDRTAQQGIRVFSSRLEEWARRIDRSIDELNDSLARVPYGQGTILQLIAEETRNREINAFRRELKACIPNIGDNSPEELERSFENIRALIDHFDEDPNWMRRVTDVRYWREFAAQEVTQEDYQQVDYYNDSSGKSGGQKAKLAYTILASAIAYQYGLQDSAQTERSFRLVVIDEAFSKLDDDNARYAMELFKQLGLQLLVVTPMQQLHIIEDYVQAYHLVVNNEEGSSSRLINLTVQEYHEKRREFAAS